MTMFKIKTRNKPRGRLVREADPTEHCVRVYQGSPEEIILQLWSGKRYLMVALHPAEARAIAEQLVNVADKLQLGEDPMTAAELLQLIAPNGVRQ